MWISQLSKGDILRRLTQPRYERLDVFHVPERRFINQPSEENVLAVWDDEPSLETTLPSVLVVRDEDQRDFLAWATTFLTSYKPFTAHFRVISFSTFNELQFRKIQC